MANTTNFGWETPDDTDLVKDGAAAMRTLGNSIDTSFVDLKGGTTGQVLSKNSNTDLDFTWVAQDDSNAIQNALLTTTGDTIYASAASTPARLGIGSTGQVLTVSGGLPVWATPAAGSTFIGCRAYRSSAQNISSASLTAVEYNAETYDTNAFHDNSTNPSRFTIPSGKGGYYALHIMLTYEENGTGFRDLRFYKNGAELQMLRSFGSSTANALTGMFASYIGNFAAGDYLECYAYQNSGSTLTVGANTNSFSIYKLGD